MPNATLSCVTTPVHACPGCHLPKREFMVGGWCRTCDRELDAEEIWYLCDQLGRDPLGVLRPELDIAPGTRMCSKCRERPATSNGRCSPCMAAYQRQSRARRREAEVAQG